MKIEYPVQRISHRPARSSFAAAILQPAALVYKFASMAQKQCRQRTDGASPPGTQIISVGNMEVGGGGKTPFCIYLLQRLSRDGQRPLYISRGYKSEAERLRHMVTVVPAESAESCPPLALGVRLVSRSSAVLSDMIGDEGAMVASRNPTVPLVMSRDKNKSVQTAARMFQPTHIVLDDAFQSWGVHRDIDIVLLDAKTPYGNGRLLPAGSLREIPDALCRADAIGLNGIDSAGDLPRAAEPVRRLVASNVPVFGIHRGISFLTAQGEDADAARGPVASLSSIARPEGFDQLARAHGCDIDLSIRYPDHYRYKAGDAAAVRRLMRKHNLQRLVTTDKDWVKLRGFDWREIQIIIGRLNLVTAPDDWLQLIKKPQASPAASL
ncbi:MAG: tetraacyldisaccharide 4'-kinase [Candidatus Latescibacterota bacterium]